ncbi:MAG TPA: hypothetical protein VNF99_03890 [Stellaceae bacterium]|nr:hypothetical protein [Stellaceae bacterium]
MMVTCLLFAMPAFAADREAVPELIDGAPSYIRFPPIFVPIIEDDQVTRQVGVTLMLQLVKGQKKQGVEAKRLQLDDAFVSDLYAFFQLHASLHSDLDQAYLKDRLLRVADAVVGPNIVQEVLIEQLFFEKK